MLYTQKTKISGFTTFELVAAIFIVTVCMVAFAQLVFSTSEYRRARQMTQAAQDQLLNVLEMLDREEPGKLKNLDFDKQPFENLLADSLPGGKIAFAVKPFPADASGNIPPDSALLEVTVTWDAGEKRPPHSLALVKWMFAAQQPVQQLPQETGEVTP